MFGKKKFGKLETYDMDNERQEVKMKKSFDKEKAWNTTKSVSRGSWNVAKSVGKGVSEVLGNMYTNMESNKKNNRRK